MTIGDMVAAYERHTREAASGAPVFVSRVIHKDRPLCDGTPRRERGYRAVVCYTDGRASDVGLVRTYAWSPLFASTADAEGWMPHAFAA